MMIITTAAITTTTATIITGMSQPFPFSFSTEDAGTVVVLAVVRDGVDTGVGEASFEGVVV